MVDWEISMDKCREAFEQLPEIKNSLGENIVFVGNKYTTANEGFYDLVNWLNGGWYTWQSRQSEFDSMTEALLNQAQLLAKKQAEVDQLKNLLEKDEHAHNLYYENANLQTLVEEKDKRVEELESHIKGQIETLKCASKSWVYTEREQNIMLSQADDLEKALRGEHE